MAFSSGRTEVRLGTELMGGLVGKGRGRNQGKGGGACVLSSEGRIGLSL